MPMPIFHFKLRLWHRTQILNLTHPRRLTPTIVNRFNRLYMSATCLSPKRALSPDQGHGQTKRPRACNPTSVESATMTNAKSAPTSECKSRHKKRKQKRFIPEPGSRDDIYWHESIKILGRETVDSIVAAGEDWDAPLHYKEEIELTISSLSSNGKSCVTRLVFLTCFDGLFRRGFGHCTFTSWPLGSCCAVLTTRRKSAGTHLSECAPVFLR